MKSYQFFKIYKRFYKKREKTVIQQSMGKEKLTKIFLFFDVRITQEISKGKLGTTNSYNLLVMNVTQINFFY